MILTNVIIFTRESKRGKRKNEKDHLYSCTYWSGVQIVQHLQQLYREKNSRGHVISTTVTVLYQSSS